MKKLITKRTTKKQYTLYLIFMLIACGGAIVWQLFIPSVTWWQLGNNSSYQIQME